MRQNSSLFRVIPKWYLFSSKIKKKRYFGLFFLSILLSSNVICVHVLPWWRKNKNIRYFRQRRSVRSILISCRHPGIPWKVAELQGHEDTTGRRRLLPRESQPVAGALVYNALHRYYRYYPYYMYYEYYTDVRATSVEQARHDGFFFLRFPLRASRLSSRRISLGSLVTLLPYILISPHLPFRPSSSIPRLIPLASRLFLLLSLLPLLSELFILRPRASGRFNVRDFFSPSLVPAPSSPWFHLSVPPKSHSCALRDVRAQQCISRLCNRTPRSTKLRAVIFIVTFFLYLKLVAQKSRLVTFSVALFFDLISNVKM